MRPGNAREPEHWQLGLWVLWMRRCHMVHWPSPRAAPAPVLQKFVVRLGGGAKRTGGRSFVVRAGAFQIGIGAPVGADHTLNPRRSSSFFQELRETTRLRLVPSR